MLNMKRVYSVKNLRNKSIYKLVSNLFIVLSIAILFAFTNTISTNNFQQNLFKIERSRNADRVVYDIRLTADKAIDQTNPFQVYWLKQSNTKTEPLTRIQKKFGYGINIINQSDNEILFKIAAIPEQTFTVKADKNNRYNAFTTIDNRSLEINSIYIAFKEGTVWIPEIDSIQLKCTDNLSKMKITKTLFPE